MLLLGQVQDVFAFVMLKQGVERLLHLGKLSVIIEYFFHGIVAVFPIRQGETHRIQLDEALEGDFEDV